MDIGGFIGRFHPLVVHLPIGFLMAAAVFEYYARKRRYQKLDTAVEISLFLGAIFAIMASGSGWLLANRGAYIEQSLFLHRWLGIAVAVLASVAWLVKTNRLSLSKSALTGLMSTMIVGLFAAGHFGGNMTHGDDYLVEYAPAFVKNLLGFGRSEEITYEFGPRDSIKIYTDLVQPALENQCWKCHRADNALGGLDMSTKATFLKGGDNGKVLEAGSAYESELFRRITLPVSNRKSMPPVGLALPYHTTRLIEWWIDAGASFDKSLTDLEVPEDVQQLLEEKYGISFKIPQAVDRIEVADAEPSAIEAVRAKGIQVAPLSATSNLLEVTARNAAELQSLESIKEQITWLNLANANLEDSQVKIVADFPHLTRLRLQGNPITDVGLRYLVDLSFLESLNLNETPITDEALSIVQKIRSLRSVYLFQTSVTEAAITELETSRPDLEVVKGFRFEAMDVE